MANRLWAEPLKASFGSKQISSPVAFLPLLHGWLVVPFVPDQKLRIDLICWRYKLPVRGEETLSISQDRVIIARRHHLCRRKLGKGAMSNRHFTLLRNVLHNTNESQKIPKILKCWEKSKVKGYLSLSCYASSTWQVFIVFFHYNWLLLLATCLFVNTVLHVHLLQLRLVHMELRIQLPCATQSDPTQQHATQTSVVMSLQRSIPSSPNITLGEIPQFSTSQHHKDHLIEMFKHQNSIKITFKFHTSLLKSHSLTSVCSAGDVYMSALELHSVK